MYMEPASAYRDQKDLPKPEVSLPREPLELEDGRDDRRQVLPRSDSLRTLLSWQSAGRPFRKRKKAYYINGILIMLAVEVILFLFSQYILMLVVLSLVFLSFALATVPPHNFQYRISTQGLTIEDYSFLWQELYDFYFTKREGQDVLIVRTKAMLPGELVITLGDIHADHVKDILLRYLPFREHVQQTFLDKSASWMERTFPLES